MNCRFKLKFRFSFSYSRNYFAAGLFESICSERFELLLFFCQNESFYRLLNYVSLPVDKYLFKMNKNALENRPWMFRGVLETRSPPEEFLRKTVLKICNKFTGEQPCQSEITLGHGCSPVSWNFSVYFPLKIS